MSEYYYIVHEFLNSTLTYEQRLSCVNDKIKQINDYIIVDHEKLRFIGLDLLNEDILNSLYDNLDVILNNLKYKYHPFNTLILLLDQMDYELRLGNKKRFMIITNNNRKEFNSIYSIIAYYYNGFYKCVHRVICHTCRTTTVYAKDIKEQLLELNLKEIYQKIKSDDKFIMLESVDGVYLLNNYKRLIILKDTDFNDLCVEYLRNIK